MTTKNRKNNNLKTLDIVGRCGKDTNHVKSSFKNKIRQDSLSPWMLGDTGEGE